MKQTDLILQYLSDEMKNNNLIIIICAIYKKERPDSLKYNDLQLRLDGKNCCSKKAKLCEFVTKKIKMKKKV